MPDDKAVDPASTTPSQDLTGDAQVDRISADNKRASELVPELGSNWRWYDIGYRVLNWLLQGRPRRLLPRRVRQRLSNGINFLFAIHHYRREKVERLDDEMHNLLVPDSETVRQGGIWVAEVFPPSHYPALHRALLKNGWGDEPWRRIDGTNAEKVTDARRRNRSTWSNLGVVARHDSRWHHFGAKRENLPTEIDHIELTAVQVGSGLTVLVAFFRLTDHGEQSLNAVWKAEHEPLLQLNGLQRPNVEGRNFAGIINTQTERLRLHNLARDWLANRCPGFFAGTTDRHPVIDYTLFEQYAPPPSQDAGNGQSTQGPAPDARSQPTGSSNPVDVDFDKAMMDPLRALGMSGIPGYNVTSPQLKGLVLLPGESLRRSQRGLQNCWGIAGNYDIVEAVEERPGRGERPYSVSTLANSINEPVRAFLMRFATERYAEQLREIFTAARDTARSTHREYGPKALDQLRTELLSSSLDLTSMARDTALLWNPKVRPWDAIAVTATPDEWLSNRPDPPEAIDLIADMGERRQQTFTELLEEDVAYRGVLATVSALGSSATSTRLSRRALMVSGSSLLVSATALLLVNGQAAWRQLLEYLSSL